MESVRVDTSHLESMIRATQAEIAGVGYKVRDVECQLDVVDGRIQEVSSEQRSMHQHLLSLIERFEAYEHRDRLAKALQLAETRIVKIRQELEHKYGYYAEVRRMATGILQGMDHGLVSPETLRNVTEETMIKTPGYWLSPTLVALVCWFDDRRDTADRAVKEALNRDDYKTTLFFMLVMRRLERLEAMMTWMDRFFVHQDPRELDREAVIILESIATGHFPQQARQKMTAELDKWIALLTQDSEYLEEQIERWNQHFQGLVADEDVPHTDILNQLSPNFAEWKHAYHWAHSYPAIRQHFSDVAAATETTEDLLEELDAILDNLVRNFDDEELPLQMEARKNQLIIDNEGDEEEALEELEEENANFQERINFLDMLSNVVFQPEIQGVSKATRGLAFAISRPWAKDGLQKFHEERLLAIPTEASLQIDAWSSTSSDGNDEKAQVTSLTRHLEGLRDQELAQHRFTKKLMIIPPVLFALSLYLGWYNWFGLGAAILAGLALIPLIRDVYGVIQAKKQVRNRYVQIIRQKTAFLQQGLSQFVVLRNDILAQENEIDRTQSYLDSLDVTGFQSSSASRNVLS